MKEIEVRLASSLPPVNRRAFLAPIVGTMLHVRLGQAQGQVTQPVLSESGEPQVIEPRRWASPDERATVGKPCEGCQR